LRSPTARPAGVGARSSAIAFVERGSLRIVTVVDRQRQVVERGRLGRPVAHRRGKATGAS
jgi:hypothetical protein